MQKETTLYLFASGMRVSNSREREKIKQPPEQLSSLSDGENKGETIAVNPLWIVCDSRPGRVTPTKRLLFFSPGRRRGGWHQGHPVVMVESHPSAQLLKKRRDPVVGLGSPGHFQKQ